jgi:hypothetical protein
VGVDVATDRGDGRNVGQDGLDEFHEDLLPNECKPAVATLL